MSGHLYLWLIPALPFAGFLLNGIFGAKLPKSLVTTIALLAPLGSFALVVNAAATIFLYVSRCKLCGPPDYGWSILPLNELHGAWITSGRLQIDFSFVLDQLSLVMLLIITGVGFLIHIYSVGYMSEERGYWRYFAYLNLFLFFMTVLVLAGNALLMFVGWEGVGLASYLLIGFWFQKTPAADAGKKAFVVNRIGDFGFLIGIFLLLSTFGNLTFAEIGARLAADPAMQGGVVTAIALCLLVGATGKSAQLPLYVWLPDAMEGPTPVSALIHAATMVTAGVYMIARTHAIYDRSPFALSVVAIVGAATALFAATIALVQTDIKRVLAYSTVSQLGYMFLGCGVAAYSVGVFHLMTHAFFKALLFLAAGSVIHGLGGEQDLRRMGGLRKNMPITFWTMTIAVVAIAGIPPFAGFFSKDAILYAAYQEGAGGKILWFVGWLTAGLTAFYMFRLWYLAFLGESRADLHAEDEGALVHARSDTKLTLEAEHHHTPHESPWSMLGPLVILAVLSVIGGWVGAGRFGAFLAPSVGARTAEAASNTLEITLTALAVLIAVIGWFVAHRLYRNYAGEEPLARASFPYKLLTHKYWVDELYGTLIVKPILAVSRFVLEMLVDFAILGGIAWLLAGMASFGGALLQRWQSGNLRSYAAWLAAGAAALLLFALVPWTTVLADVGIHLNSAGH
ncbi:NADH-quinone oxidoreductase subunit L [Acidobacteria bacterium AB60]|nr:NADH-quinone oxidoreductase subunit L [Acidobacteria bacterium AB60]